MPVRQEKTENEFERGLVKTVAQKMERSRSRSRKKYVPPIGFILILFALFNIFEQIDVDSDDGDRLIYDAQNDEQDTSLLDWVEMPNWRGNLKRITEKPNGTPDSVLLWHIPKCGGTTAKKLYECMGKTITTRVGTLPHYGHQDTNELVVFQPYEHQDWKTINVDTTTLHGILRAKRMRLVQSHLADVIVSMEMGTAVRHLYNKRDNGQNKGRVLALFRHPIDRLVSKFYYLQVATWEKSYRPEWNDLSLLEWAKNNKRGGADSNIMVQKLTGKAWSDRVGEKDLRVAKKILRDHVVVGLLDDAEESFRRFNIVLGIDERLERNERCMNELFSSKENSNNHPKVSSWALCNTFRLFLPSCTFLQLNL